MRPETSMPGSYIEVEDARLHMEVWGTAETPVLLCLHGLGGGTHFFGALGPALAADCRTVAIDLPGSGSSPLLDAAQSSSSLAFSFDAVADLVVSLARREQARGADVCLLGHSMGTILALEAIRRCPDLIAGLIIAGGLPEPLPDSRTRIGNRAEAIRQRGIAGMGPEVVAANFSQRTQNERSDLTAWFAGRFERQNPIAYAATADALSAWTARSLPPLDRTPCLVITGEEDRYAPPDAIRAFARTLPGQTRVEIMRDCGHLPFLEQPAAFAALVSAFLRER
jgi:pimeloyl-ACP methyl ester carboxylesterase